MTLASANLQRVGVCHFSIYVASDQTNATIVTYMGGIFGRPGSTTGDDACIRLPIPERLRDQHCFRTEKALEALQFEGSEPVWAR